jgi:hypothetical protein
LKNLISKLFFIASTLLLFFNKYSYFLTNIHIFIKNPPSVKKTKSFSAAPLILKTEQTEQAEPNPAHL